MQEVFESDRLLCRHLLLEDLPALYEVYSDPLAMRWVGDGLPITEAQCEEWYEVTQSNYSKYGYGMCALVERSTGKVVGFCGLVHPSGLAEAEIKYALLQSHWGQGLASEAVPELLAYGASEHGLNRVIATVAPENFASRRVLEKVGMILFGERQHSGGITLVYEWRQPE